MHSIYTPADWFWVVGGDVSRAWSSADGAWVTTWPDGRVTRIASAEDLDGVLRHYGLRSPVITADDVRAEASRRILERYPGWKQTNMVARGVELQDIWRRIGTWTPEEQADADALQSSWHWISAVRAASNQIEALDPMPEDINNDSLWPE